MSTYYLPVFPVSQPVAGIQYLYAVSPEISVAYEFHISFSLSLAVGEPAPRRQKGLSQCPFTRSRNVECVTVYLRV